MIRDIRSLNRTILENICMDVCVFSIFIFHLKHVFELFLARKLFALFLSFNYKEAM